MALAFALGLIVFALVARRLCHRVRRGLYASDCAGCLHGGVPPHHHFRARGTRRGGRWRGRLVRRWLTERISDELDANAVQDRVIAAQVEAIEQRLLAVREALGSPRRDLGEALAAATLDDAALDQATAGIEAAVAEARAAILDGLRAIHAVLDEQQRARLGAIIGGGAGSFAWYGAGPYR